MCANGQKKGTKFIEAPAGKEMYFEDNGDGRKVMKWRDKPAGAAAAPDNTNQGPAAPGTGGLQTANPDGTGSAGTAGSSGSGAAGDTSASNANVLTDNGITGGAADLQPGGNVSLGGTETRRKRKGVIGLNI